jgi:hypothetical protein
MKSIIASALLLFALAVPAQAQPPFGLPRPVPPVGTIGVANLNGFWYLNGNRRAPCQIMQEWPRRQAIFINERGSRAWGSIHGDRVWIPDWSDGVSHGLTGWIRGNRIIWPTGSFWSR